ncbi:hypothetical protein cgR_0358 [Corynebacterium glutamicum R]|uniref:Reelin domain-containing protein n=1 Tax=Corynebacterium glutamicum (strain R) TaxID=340322 RepID=A0AB72V7V8_CORGB|nr:hypothetical protein cgR_0358 [Corynebacterium glutamicum R]
MQIMDAFWIDPGQRSREEICLFLIVAFERYAITWLDE